MQNYLFCSVCGDQIKAAYPCKFVFHDGIEVEFNVCLECMDGGILEIDLSRKRLVAKILGNLNKK